MASLKELLGGPQTPAEVAKAIVYLALGAAGALVPALSDNVVTPIEIVQASIIVIGLVPVYLFAGTGAKTAAAFAITGLQVVLNLLAQYTGFADIPLSAWLTVVISAFAGIGVAVLPNAPANSVVPEKVEVVKTAPQTEPLVAVLAETDEVSNPDVIVAEGNVSLFDHDDRY